MPRQVASRTEAPKTLRRMPDFPVPWEYNKRIESRAMTISQRHGIANGFSHLKGPTRNAMSRCAVGSGWPQCRPSIRRMNWRQRFALSFRGWHLQTMPSGMARTNPSVAAIQACV